MGCSKSKQFKNDRYQSIVDHSKSKRFLCWDKLDPEWLAPFDYQDDRIYVHLEILEWIVEHINKTLDEFQLNDILKGTVEEVHHHNLNGSVFLIKFYEWAYFSKKISVRHVLKPIKDRLKYTMPWKSNRTYFLRIDSGFECRKIRIMDKLRELNVLDYLNVMFLELNWLFIPNIEMYEFREYLSEDKLNKIDWIFQEISESQASIYICNQFEWHKDLRVGHFIDVDTLAIDICAEEWRRHDLLNDFPIEDILRLDLANKDYRDPHCNEYLNMYLDFILQNSLQKLFVDNNDKFEFPAYRFPSYLGHYFISRFYDKISAVGERCYNYLELSYDIPRIVREEDVLDLDGDQPPPETLLPIQCHKIIYNISNYSYLSNSLFRVLLDKSCEDQTYNFRFDKKFNFLYERDEQFERNLKYDCKWSVVHYKNIAISLENCIASSAENLSHFLKYLIILFEERRALQASVSINFNNCLIDDYSFLEGIGSSIGTVIFTKLNISNLQLCKLSSILKQQKSVRFVDCNEITDRNVMTLLKNIQLDRLYIEGTNACTPNVYYLMAEHLMNLGGVNSIEAQQFTRNVKDCSRRSYFDFDFIEFFKNDNQIVARNHRSKQIVDLYCLINYMPEDDSFDSKNNIYIE